jgi:hypothetical protein
MQGLLQDTALRDQECSAVAYSLGFLREKEFPRAQLDQLLSRCREVKFIRMNL